MDKNLLSIKDIDNFSTCGIDKTFISILDIEKLSIFDIDRFFYIMYRQYVYV